MRFAESALEKIIKKITTATNFVLFLIMVIMGLVLAGNIAMRFLFETPISWSNVISRYCYIYVVLLGTAISYIEGSHATFNSVYAAVPQKLKVLFNISHYLIMIIFCIILLIYGAMHVVTMWPVSSPIVPFLSIGFVYLSVPISAVIMILFLLQKILGLKNQGKG